MRTRTSAPIRFRGRHELRARHPLVPWLLSAVLVLAVLAPAEDIGRRPAPIPVTIAGEIRYIPQGTTLGRLARQFRLRPRKGDLVDVEGVVLVRNRYPGDLLVNGQPAEPGRVVEEGDRVGLRAGRDRAEHLEQELISVRPGTVQNPQFQLGSGAGTQVVNRGRISGKVASSVFRPLGPARNPRQVALTFDDGPTGEYTPRILAVLQRLHVRATFFVIGHQAQKRPDLIRREVAAGMSVGNHTMLHPYAHPFAELPKANILREVRDAATFLRTLGVQPTVFRPPGGSWSQQVVNVAQHQGMRTVMWSVDSRDWARPPPSTLTSTVLAAARPGSIIVLHDGGGNRESTVKALPRIIRGLRSRGLELVAL